MRLPRAPQTVHADDVRVDLGRVKVPLDEHVWPPGPASLLVSRRETIQTHSARKTRKARRRTGVSVSPNDNAALSSRSRPAAGAGFVSVWNDLLR